MNVTLQMAREDFPTHLVGTLERFLRWRDLRDYSVGWDQTCDGGDCATWFLHPRLALLAPRWLDPRPLAFLRGEYGSAGGRIGRAARKLYVALHSLPGPTRGALAEHRVAIRPSPLDGARCFALPGNNSLRWFDPKAGLCYVALKSGFPLRYFADQLAVRREFEDVPAPRLVGVDDEERIYIEEIARGTPASAAETARQPAIAARALRLLAPLHNASRETSTASDYIGSLLEGIESHTASDVFAAADHRDAINLLAERLASAIAAPTHIDTVQSHGDLSFGHILETQYGAVLVDWEHTYRRQKDADALTLALRPQLPSRFFALVANPDALRERVRDLLDAEADNLEWQIPLLVLEQLHFFCRNHDNAALRTTSDSLLKLLAEAATWLDRRSS